MERGLSKMQPVWKRLASLPLVSVLFLSACGGKFFPKETGGGGKTSSGDYLYVANTSVNPFTIAAFSIANSKLNTISGSPFNFGAAQPSALVVTPKHVPLCCQCCRRNLWLQHQQQWFSFCIE